MDKVEAQRNINLYVSEINKYQSLSRSLMSRDEMIVVDHKIMCLKERVKNLREVLYAQC